MYVYLHENHKKSTIHVGKYTNPMDPMGLVYGQFHHQESVLLFFFEDFHLFHSLDVPLEVRING